jgi:hypothetical protein
MSNLGGGLLTNGRTQQAPPEMNMPQVSAPQQASSAPQQMPQGGPPQGAQAVQAPGAPQPSGPAQADSGVSTVSDLSLTLLHDPQIGAEYQKLIAQGPEAAAQVAVQLYEKVIEGFQGQGQAIDDMEGAEAAEVVMEDIAAMGVGMTAQQQGQGFESEPSDGNGTPMSVKRFQSMTLDLLAQRFPDIQASIQQIAGEPTSPDEQADGESLGQYMSQFPAQGQASQGGMPQAGPPQGQAPQGAQPQGLLG